MEPIISPIYIYAISFIKNLDAFLFIVMVVSLLAILFTFFMMATDWNFNDFPFFYKENNPGENQRMKTYRKIIKYSLIVAVVSGIVKVFIPTEREMYAMMMAPQITPENLDIVANKIIDFVKKIQEVK